MADVEKGTRPEHGHHDQPPLQEVSQFGDSSGPLFSMYSKIAEKDDRMMAERWQKDADGVIIFAGLLSATVATLLSISIPDLKPNSQDVSAFYLKNIYQQLVDANVSVPSTVATPPTFSPSRRAVMANLFWVLCLYNSLLVAGQAMTLQTWSRRYLKFTQPFRRGPRRRARTCALFAGSVDNLFIRTLSLWLPSSVHLSLFLFMVGLVIFLFDINNVLFIHILWQSLAWTAIYIYLTALPLFQQNSLLYTPMSVFPAVSLILMTHFFYLRSAHRFKFKIWSVFEWLFEDVSDPVDENIASKRSSEIDARVLESTLNSLDEDKAMKKFFEAVPGFFSSKWVKLTSTNLPARLQDVFKEVLYEFLDYTFKSTMIPESAKASRLTIGLDASRSALGPNGPSYILRDILDGNWPEPLRSVEIGHSLRSWAYSNDEENTLLIRSIISHIVARAENRNDHWLTLARDQLGMSEELLRDYLGLGDSVLLANLIDITRFTFRCHPPNWKFHSLPSKCDVSSALPSLQHDFCALWNEIALEAQDGKGSTYVPILDDIRPVYIALHSGTDASPNAFSAAATDMGNQDRLSSYPLCDIASHRSDPTPHDYNEAVEDVSLAIHSPIHSVPHHSPGPVLVSGTHSFDMSAHHTTRDRADRADKSFGDVSDAPQSYPSVSFLDASAAPFMANLDPHPISRDAVSSHRSEAIISPSIIETRSTVVSSSADSAVTQTGYPAYRQGFGTLSPSTMHAHISPQVISDFDARITTRITTIHAQDDTLTPNIPIPIVISRHPSESSRSSPDMIGNISRPGDSQQGQRRS